MLRASPAKPTKLEREPKFPELLPWERVIRLHLKSSQGVGSIPVGQNLGHSAHLWSEVLTTTHSVEGSRCLLNDGPAAVLCANLTVLLITCQPFESIEQ